MRRLFIIGAGGFGREVLGWITDVITTGADFQIAGFLDSNPSALASFSFQVPIVGDPLSFDPDPDAWFVCAIGDPDTKLRLCRSLKERGANFLTLVHPTAVIGPDCRVGEGCVLCPGAVLTTNVVLADFVTLNVYATVGHDVTVGEGCTLSGHSDVTGAATLGRGVFLGSHASVLPGGAVGDYAVVGAGSVVLRRVAANTTVMGVPARQIGGFRES